MDQQKIDQYIFIGGAIASGVSFMALVISILIGKLRAERLKAKLNEEYGKKGK